MIIKFQKASAIFKTAKSGYGILSAGSLGVTPDVDPEVLAACCITLAFSGSTSTSIHVSPTGRAAEIDANAHLRNAGFVSSDLMRRALEAISRTLFTWRGIRCILGSSTGYFHFAITLAESSRRTARQHA